MGISTTIQRWRMSVCEQKCALSAPFMVTFGKRQKYIIGGMGVESAVNRKKTDMFLD